MLENGNGQCGMQMPTEGNWQGHLDDYDRTSGHLGPVRLDPVSFSALGAENAVHIWHSFLQESVH